MEINIQTISGSRYEIEKVTQSEINNIKEKQK